MYKGIMEQIDIINEIQIKYASFSKGHKKVADYILTNYEKAAFMTAKKLAGESNTSESTVVRFAFEMGFESYTQFQRALADLIQKRLTEPAAINIECNMSSPKDILRSVLKFDSDNIARTLDIIDYISFENSIDYILDSENIYIIGLGNCGPLSQYFHMYLNLIRPGVKLISTSSSSEIFEQLIHLSDNDCVVGIGFPDYSVRTLKALEYANEQKARIISITDNRYSPMNLYSSCNLYAASDMMSEFDSLTSAFSVINALIIGLRKKAEKSFTANINKLNDIWDNYS